MNSVFFKYHTLYYIYNLIYGKTYFWIIDANKYISFCWFEHLINKQS